MQVSIVLPAYNEESCIGRSLERILDFCHRELSDWEVLVVDDGSSDATAQIAGRFAGVRCLRNEENRGKGHTVRRGMMEAVGDVILFTDVDLSTPIEEALSLLRAIEGGADVAVASRQRRAGKRIRRAPHRAVMAAVFRFLVKLIVLRGFHDTQCGFKMFRRGAARQIFACQRLEGWAFDVEILFIARRMGHEVVEVPVDWTESEQSSLSLLSPIRMLLDLLRIRALEIRGAYGRPRRS